MLISDFAIKRPVVTVVTMIALVLFGVFALVNSEVDEFPTITSPIVSITVAYPGAIPSQVERDVVDQIEEAVSAISGVDQISSQAVDGFASITAQFVFSKDANLAMQEVRDAISGMRAQLPAMVDEPILRKFDPTTQPIVSLALSSGSLSTAELTAIADPGITKALRGINGVAQVNVSGGSDREITVNVRPADLQASGLTIDAVVSAVQAQNLSSPVGRITSGGSEHTIRFQGRMERPADFRELVITQRSGRVVRLRDVADVSDGTGEARTTATYDGREAVGIDIQKTTDASTTTVADAVVRRVTQLQRTLPAGSRLDVVKNSGVNVRNSVHNVEGTLIEGAALTVLVVFLFLNSWRSTVITGLALPVSVIAAFIPVWAFGFTLNSMSLLGISLAIGILVDDAIVVRENIVRHIEMGKDRARAAHEGTNEIGLAVTATTFSIVAVFVPIAFMGGIPGQFFKPFALTIAAAVLVSLFVSFSLDPMLSAYWPDPEHERADGAAPRKQGTLTRVVGRFNAWFNRQTSRYGQLVGWALDHRWWMVALAAGSFVLALGLLATLGGVAFVPTQDRSEVNIAVETPPGSSLEYTRAKAEDVARLVRTHGEVQATYTTVGSTTGSGEVDAATVYVRLVPKGARDASQTEVSEQLRQELTEVAGASVYIYASGFGGNEKALQVELRGSNGDDLSRGALLVMGAMRQVPGAVDIGLSTKGDRPEVSITLDRDMAGTLGLTAADVAQSLRPAFAGVDAGDWVDPSGETRDVTVRLAPSARRTATNLRDLPFVVNATSRVANAPNAEPTSVTPSTISLGQIARVVDTTGPARIDHLDREQVVVVGANVIGESLGDVRAAIMQRVRQLPLPPTVRITEGGMGERQSELFSSVLQALAMAVLLMYLILVMQFGSFLDPLAIVISLPLSLIGVVVALLITGDTLNLMSMIGIILLMGLVAKNAILLIDFAKWEHERGRPLREALIEAGRVRLRPIMMTTVALISGMVPVAIGQGEGADFRAPLGRAVIGGMIASTILTLVVIPTIYEILYDWRRALTARFRWGSAVAPAPATTQEEA